jgi:hypothetical protein
MLMAFFYVCKIVEIHHQKNSITLLNFYCKFSKKIDKVYNDIRN